MENIFSYIKSWFVGNISKSSFYSEGLNQGALIKTQRPLDILLDWLKHYIFQFLERDDLLKHYLHKQNKAITYNFEPLPSRYKPQKAIEYPSIEDGDDTQDEVSLDYEIVTDDEGVALGNFVSVEEEIEENREDMMLSLYSIYASKFKE